jgi:hypothetical protein
MVWPIIAALGGLFGGGAAAGAGAGAAGAGAGAASMAAPLVGGGGASGATMFGGATLPSMGANLGMPNMMNSNVGGGPGGGLWTDLISPDTPIPEEEDPWYTGLLGSDTTSESSPPPALGGAGGAGQAPALHAPPQSQRRPRERYNFNMPASIRSLMGG